MTARRRIKNPVTVVARQAGRSGTLHGAVRVIHPAIRQVGSPWQYEPATHTYKVPAAKLDDVMAAIELAGHNVDFQSVLW